MKRTKLKLVQDVLSQLDLDEVNAIGETIESEQVASMVDNIYDDMLGDDKPWPHLRSFSRLEITPIAHQFKLPNDVFLINDLWYNKEYLEYMKPSDFMDMMIRRDTTQSNIDSNGAYTDQDPRYWTSYDDTYVTVDAYDGSLISALSTADIFTFPAQMTEDTDYPDIPERFHKTIYHGALADAFYTLKGDTTGFNIYNNRYKREKRIMDRWISRINRTQTLNKRVNYGRKWA